MYSETASKAEMDAFGFGEDDYGEEDAVGVWPCNWQAVQLFGAVSTQWRVGFGGAYGLDYQAVAAVMDMRGIKRKRRGALFDDIQIMEAEVLAMWREKENG